MDRFTYQVTELGQRLQHCREAQGWNQSELATRSGIPQPTISRLEAGKLRNCKIMIIVRLAQALQYSIDWLCGISPEQEVKRQKQPPHEKP